VSGERIVVDLGSNAILNKQLKVGSIDATPLLDHTKPQLIVHIIQDVKLLVGVKVVEGVDQPTANQTFIPLFDGEESVLRRILWMV
jgi:hypothetical protein